jgi:dihydrolipoamide dehydrogenase
MSRSVVVLGAGPAGYVCAIRLAQLGQKVTVVEKSYLGGTCLNVGCIPSKALIAAGSLVDRISHASAMGISADNVRVDTAKLVEWKAGIVAKLTGGVGGLLKNHKCEVLMGTGSIVDKNTVAVKLADGSTRTVKCDDIVIATGSVPIAIPGFAFDEKDVWSSTGALAPKSIPKHLVVIGGGYIGLELGQTFQRLGSKLTVVEGLERILMAVDKDLGEPVAKQIKADGGEILTSTKALGWREEGGRALVKVETAGVAREIPADVVLVSVGRRPITAGLGLDKVGVKLDSKGFIVVDERMQTSVPGIFAAGDVVGQPMLAHKASHEGELIAEIIAGKKRINDVRTIPAVVFTEPEIASAGLTRTEAEARGHKVTEGKFPFSASGRAMAIDETKGFVKVIADADDERLLGVHIVGPEASDLISEAALAIEMGAYVPDVALTIHPHPTLGEAVMEAAKHAIGEAIHIANARKH